MMCRSRVDHSTLRRKRLAVLSALLLALAMGCGGRTCPDAWREERQFVCNDAPCTPEEEPPPAALECIPEFLRICNIVSGYCWDECRCVNTGEFCQ
jgi:hypothetical protein